MLKKLTHITIVVLLLLATTGVTVFKHYCGNLLVSKSIGLHPKSCCGDGHCNKCHNDKYVFKIIDDFESSSLEVNFKCLNSNLIKSLGQNIFSDLNSLFNPTSVYFIYHRSYIAPPLLAMDYCAQLQVYRL